MNQLTTNQRQEFITCARGILASETVQKMKQYPQHGKTNALCHMVSVAWCAYSTAIKLEEKYGIRFDRRSIIRGSLLHDLFLYDWHDPNNGHKSLYGAGKCGKALLFKQTGAGYYQAPYVPVYTYPAKIPGKYVGILCRQDLLCKRNHISKQALYCLPCLSAASEASKRR